MAGSYGIVQADLRFTDERLKQLTSSNGASIDSSKVDNAIVAAEDELHGYAEPHYVTPLRTADGSTPSGIKLKLEAASRWYLMQNRPESLRGGDDEGEQWEKRREEHVEWLQSIADPNPKTRMVINAVARSAEATAETRSGTATVVSDTQRFTLTATGGMF